MKQDVVITSASGYTFRQIKYWVNSLDRCGFAGQRVVVVGNAETDLVRHLERRGCHVVTRETLLGAQNDAVQTRYLDDHMSVDRYFLFWKFLTGLSSDDIRYVIAVDIRDAVFQLNPSVWLVENIGDKQFVVASEGLTYEDQP